MLKLEIRLNEEQISQESAYSCESIYIAIDKVFSKYQFRKEHEEDGTICYYGNGSPKDYATFGRLITSLKDKPWFMAYLEKWLWYNSDDGETEDDFTVDDILYHYTKRESVA